MFVRQRRGRANLLVQSSSPSASSRGASDRPLKLGEGGALMARQRVKKSNAVEKTKLSSVVSFSQSVDLLMGLNFFSLFRCILYKPPHCARTVEKTKKSSQMFQIPQGGMLRSWSLRLGSLEQGKTEGRRGTSSANHAPTLPRNIKPVGQPCKKWSFFGSPKWISNLMCSDWERSVSGGEKTREKIIVYTS